MRPSLYVVTSCLLFCTDSFTVVNAQHLLRDPIIKVGDTVDTTFLAEDEFNEQYPGHNGSVRMIASGINLSDLQTFSYKRGLSPWRLGIFSGANFAYCGTWENTFGPNKRDNTLYNGTGLNMTGSVDYYFTKNIGFGTTLGYQNYVTRDVYHEYMNRLAASEGIARDQVKVLNRPSQDLFLMVGPVISLPFTRSRRNPVRQSVLELGIRGGLFSTNAAIIAATVPAQNNRLLRSVGPASGRLHTGGLFSLGLFFPLGNRWQLGLRAQGFYTGLNYLIVNGTDDQEFQFHRKHGGFSLGAAIRMRFPRRRLVPYASDTTSSQERVQKLGQQQVISSNPPRDPIIKIDDTIDTTFLAEDEFNKQYSSGSDLVRITAHGLNSYKIQTFFYKQRLWPWRLGLFSGVNLAYCGLWENTAGSNERNNTAYNGAGLNITGTVDYLVTPATRRLRVGIGAAFGYQNYNTRSVYRDYLYDLAARRRPSVDRDQVSIRQGASVNSFLTVGPLITHTIGKRATAIEVGLRGGLFRTEAATISAFIPSQFTAYPAGPLIEGGALLRRVSPGSQLYYAGSTVSLGVFIPFGKNWQLGIQVQGFYTKLNYLLIDGINGQVTPHKRPYAGLSSGAALRMLLPRRRLVPTA